MFGEWRNEQNTLDEWMERKLGPRLSRIAAPVVATALDIAAAPVELAQRIFWRPNTKGDERLVEDLHAKSKRQLTQTYLDGCTQTFYAEKKSGLRFDPKRTHENLDACTSGTFKMIAVGAQNVEEADTLPITPVAPEHHAPNSVSIARMTDSQIISGRPRSLLVRPFKGEYAANEFGATASGTFVPLSGFHKWQQENAPQTPANNPKKSGSFPAVLPGENPHGLKQFMRSSDRERGS